MNDYKNFAIKVARQSGEIMLKYFDTDKLEAKYKTGNEPVTIADKKINQLVIDEVAKNYPEHAVNGEEQSNDIISDYVWVCDPIDGTTPFMKGIPVAVFSLALVHKGKSILGVVYDPFLDRLYVAEKGMGAFCNKKRLTVNHNNLENGIVNVEWWQDGIRDVVAPMHNFALESQTYPIHIPSIVYASMLVAKGEIEASIFPGGKGKNVDIAAVKIIVEEAGGKVTDLDGQDQRYDKGIINGAIISNGIEHNKIVEILSKKITA